VAAARGWDIVLSVWVGSRFAFSWRVLWLANG
jgi:hypothetical protein